MFYLKVGQPVSGTSGMGIKRIAQDQSDHMAKKKLKRSGDLEDVGKPRRSFESDESGRSPKVFWISDAFWEEIYLY